jgi:hypothetical protein
MVEELGLAAGGGDDLADPDATDLPETPVAGWDAVRADYHAGALTHYGLSRKHGVSLGALHRRIRENKWNDGSRAADADRRLIVAKLFGVVELQAEQIGRLTMTGTGDKEVSALNKLAATLEKLIALEGAGQTAAAKPPASKDLIEMRARIARRLEEIRKG